MKISGIYKIVNRSNGKYYVGSSDNIKGTGGRWDEHINDLNRGNHDNEHLQRSWNKYGEPTFDFSIVETVPKPNLLIVEQKYLDIAKQEKLKTYNMSFVASGGGFAGHHHTEKSKQQISQKLKGRVSPNKGKKHPELSGKNNPNYSHQIHSFINIKTSEMFIGTRYEFYSKYSLCRPAVEQLVTKKALTHRGWRLFSQSP